MNTLHTLDVPKPRHSAKLRRAVELRVRKGMPIASACEAAGLSQSGWFKAMQRPAVRALLAETQAAYVSEVEGLRAAAQVQAIETARDLMQNAKSESIRARMAECLAAGSKNGSGENVHVETRQIHPQGYEFARPDQKIVEIVEVNKEDPQAAPSQDETLDK